MPSRIDFTARSRTIMSQMTLKTITLRLTPETFARAAALAQLRGRSLNRLFQDGFKLLDEREREVMTRRFGLDQHNPHTLEEVAQELKS